MVCQRCASEVEDGNVCVCSGVSYGHYRLWLHWFGWFSINTISHSPRFPSTMSSFHMIWKQHVPSSQPPRGITVQIWLLCLSLFFSVKTFQFTQALTTTWEWMMGAFETRPLVTLQSLTFLPKCFTQKPSQETDILAQPLFALSSACPLGGEGAQEAATSRNCSLLVESVLVASLRLLHTGCESFFCFVSHIQQGGWRGILFWETSQDSCVWRQFCSGLLDVSPLMYEVMSKREFKLTLLTYPQHW